MTYLSIIFGFVFMLIFTKIISQIRLKFHQVIFILFIWIVIGIVSYFVGC